MFRYETMKCEDYYTRNQLIYVTFLDLIQHLSQFVALVFLRTTIFHRTPNTMAMVKHVWWIPVSFRFHQHIVIVFAPVPTNVKSISQLKNNTQYESILDTTDFVGKCVSATIHNQQDIAILVFKSYKDKWHLMFSSI